jgi:hypothetical protein
MKYVEYFDKDSYVFILRKSSDDKFIYINKINEQSDYNLFEIWKNAENINFDYPLPDYDTLLSYSLIKNDFFIAVNDYNGILKHYYCLHNNLFICSNNSFLVAFLSDSKISDEAIYEVLFFRFPYKIGSYFNKVESLKPFQVLKFNLETKSLKLSNSISQTELVDNLGFESLSQAADDFFLRLKFENPVNISFSGGSDSTAIAALLTKYNIPFNLVSFEGHNKYDTKKIKYLSKKVRKPLIMINAKEQNITDEQCFEYTILSNGNLVSVHLLNFYKNMIKSCIFDGYSFNAGDFSDAYISDIHGHMLKKNDLNYLDDYFLGLDKKFITDMKNYINDNYKFINCDSNDGLKYIQKYLFDFVNSTVHAGVILSSLYFGHDNYSFYLSKKFILTVIKNKYGLAKSFSKRNDYPGYAESKYALGVLAYYCNNKFCYVKLDKGLSLMDIYNNTKNISKIKRYIDRKKNAFINKYILDKKNLFTAEYEHLNEKLVEFANRFVSDNSILNKKTVDAIDTLNMVDKSLSTLNNYFVNNEK